MSGEHQWRQFHSRIFQFIFWLDEKGMGRLGGLAPFVPEAHVEDEHDHYGEWQEGREHQHGCHLSLEPIDSGTEVKVGDKRSTKLISLAFCQKAFGVLL